MLHAQAQSAYGISEDLVERVLRTFLESNRGAPAEQPAPVLRRPTRFACDIIGTTDVDEKEMGRLLPGACFQTLRRSHASSKKRGRAAEKRVTFATQWSYLAAALSNPSQRCNSVNVVATVLPMLLQGSPHLGQGYETGTGKEALLAAAAVHAKYWFYNYNQASRCCANSPVTTVSSTTAKTNRHNARRGNERASASRRCTRRRCTRNVERRAAYVLTPR